MAEDTPDLAAFIRERLGEDEAAAHEAARDVSHRAIPETVPDGLHGYSWEAVRGLFGGVEVACGEWGRVTVTQLAVQHIARHDPARVLAEVAAKRRIVDEHRVVHFTDAVLRIHDQPVCWICHAVLDEPPEWDESRDWLFPNVQQPFPCLTLRLLALPYADHPDYRTEWRP